MICMLCTNPTYTPIRTQQYTPSTKYTPIQQVHTYTQVVDGLIAISDYYRRRVLQHMCKYQYVGRTRSPINTSMRGDGGGGGGGMREPYRRSVTSLGAMMRHVASGRGGMGDIGEEDVPSGGMWGVGGLCSDLFDGFLCMKLCACTCVCIYVYV